MFKRLKFICDSLLGNDDFNFEFRLQNLPLDVLFEIFGYLESSQVMAMKNECVAFKVVANGLVKHKLQKLGASLEKKVDYFQNQLRREIGRKVWSRNNTAKSLLMFRKLLADYWVLQATLGRYVEDSVAWSLVANHLTPVLEEMSANASRAESIIAKRGFCEAGFWIHMPQFQKLLQGFDENLEIHLFRSPLVGSFEMKLLEILSCSLETNFRVTLLPMSFRFMANFDLRRPVDYPPEMTKNLLKDERSLLRWARKAVLKANASYCESLYRELCHLEGLQVGNIIQGTSNSSLLISRIENHLTTISRSPFEKVFFEESSTGGQVFLQTCNTNVVSDGLKCSFQGSYPPGFPFRFVRRYRKSRVSEEFETMGYTSEEGGSCFLCRMSQPHRIGFRLSVLKSLPKPLVKETRVTFGSKEPLFQAEVDIHPGEP